jgi:hypothetical protein
MEEKDAESTENASGYAAVLQHHAQSKGKLAIIDLAEPETGQSRIHSLESIAHLKRKKATQLLAIELERLRILNGRMGRIIDRFLAQRPEELGPRATEVRDQFVQTLANEGQQHHDVYLKIGRGNEPQGSLYIAYGFEIIRYRWEETDGPQFIYLNSESNFIRAKSSAYVSFERFRGYPLPLVFDEESSTRPLSRVLSAQQFEAAQIQFEFQQARYNRLPNRILRLVGIGLPAPAVPDEIIVAPRLSPEDIGCSYEEHTDAIRSLGIISTGLEQACTAIQGVWAVALAADDKAQSFD